MNSIANTPPPLNPPTREEVAAWLDYALADLNGRRAEVLDAMAEMLETPVDSPEVAGVYVENVRMACDLEKRAKAELDAHKRPYLDAGRVVDGYRNAFLEPLSDRIKSARSALLAWEQAKIAAARAEVARRAALAAEQAEQARLEAERVREREGLFSAATSVLDEAAEAAALAAMRAQQAAEAKGHTLSRTVGSYGATAAVRSTWTHKLIDLAQVPLAFHVLDDAKVKARMRTLERDPVSGRPLADIPGLEWVEEHSLAVR
jgi:hypothetical protein